MLRSLLIAAAAIGISVPALADEPKAPANQSPEFARQQVSDVSAEVEAQKHLISQGYTAVSHLERDSNGRWTGTATKDGKNVIVAIKIPAATATN